MDPRSLIAGRIDVQMRRHLGQPVDTYRALHDARYVRDLLFVCDAMDDTELPHLAQAFRDADERTAVARQVLAPREHRREAMPVVPPSRLVNAPRLVSFGRAR